MEWALGIITGLFIAALLTLTGNGWMCGWIFVGGVFYVACVVLRGICNDSREHRNVGH